MRRAAFSAFSYWLLEMIPFSDCYADWIFPEWYYSENNLFDDNNAYYFTLISNWDSFFFYTNFQTFLVLLRFIFLPSFLILRSIRFNRLSVNVALSDSDLNYHNLWFRSGLLDSISHIKRFFLPSLISHILLYKKNEVVFSCIDFIFILPVP